MKVGDVVKIKKLASYYYGGHLKYFVSNWNNINRGIIYRITKDEVIVTKNNLYYTFKEQEIELINWLKII